MNVNEDSSTEAGGLVLRAEPRPELELRHACERHAEQAGLKYHATIEIKSEGGANPAVTVTIDGIGVTTFADLDEAGQIEEVAKTTIERIKQRRAELPAVRIPPMNVVRSNSIAEIGHNGDALFVRFKNGGLYRYPGVPAEKYTALKRAESVGKHLQVEILRHYSGYVVPEKE